MAIYYVYSGAAGSANGTNWANAYTTLSTAFSGKAAGDSFYVAHDHAESTASSVSLQTTGVLSNPCKVVCVNRAGTVPPVSADRRTTGQVAVSGTSNALNFLGVTHYDGLIFINSATSGTIISIPSVNTVWHRFDNCSIRLSGTGTGLATIGNANGGQYIEFNNTTLSFAAVGQTVSISGNLKWRNTPSALIGAAVPTTLFTPGATRGGDVECIGVDFSAAGSGKTLVGANNSAMGINFKFVDCKLNASVTKSAVPTAHGGTEIDFLRSGATGINYGIFRHRISGTLDEETTIIRSGGATDGTTPISWKAITTANCNYSMPFECPPIAIWNDATGSAKTATIECIASAIMTDQECWVDLEYLGDASSPQGSFVNDGMANLLTTAVNQTTSTATWGGALTGKFKLEVTFTAQQKGWIYARVKCAKASSTFYIDPLITLT